MTNFVHKGEDKKKYVKEMFNDISKTYRFDYEILKKESIYNSIENDINTIKVNIKHIIIDYKKTKKIMNIRH